MRAKLDLQVRIRIEFNKEELDLITDAIRSHKDMKMECEVGGKWYGVLQSEDIQHEFTLSYIESVLLTSLIAYNKNTKEVVNKLGKLVKRSTAYIVKYSNEVEYI